MKTLVFFFTLLVLSPACQSKAPATPTPLSPSPSPNPSSPPNRPPTVNVRGGGSCHPKVNARCTIEFSAEASDPDGDALTYRWSGCASGGGRTALCTIPRPGLFTGEVEVEDARGLTGRASATAEGVNLPPRAEMSGGYTGWTDSNGRPYLLFFGNVFDDEGFTCGRQYCNGTSASGPCRVYLNQCTCLAGLEVEIHLDPGPGTCTAELHLKDEWGASGVWRHSFPVP